MATIERLNQGNRRLERMITQVGEEPPPEQQSGFVYSVFDTLDTPRQWAAGTIAKFAGLEDYKKLGILDAAALSAERDLTSSDILRESGFDVPYLTPAVGLGFDIATDPLTYLSFGTSGAVKAGGKTLSQTGVQALKNATKVQTANRLADALVPSLKFMQDGVVTTIGKGAKQKVKKAASTFPGRSDALESFKQVLFESMENPKLSPEQLLETISTKASQIPGQHRPLSQLTDIAADTFSAANKDVDEAFRIARAAVEEKRSLKNVTDPRLIDTNIMRQNVARQKLQLGGDVVLEDLFEPKRLRFMGSEIPIVSDLLADAAGTALKGFNTVRYVAAPAAAALQAAIEVLPGGEAITKGAKLVADLPAALGGQVSRRIQSTGKVTGSDLAKYNITEFEHARNALKFKELRATEDIFEGLDEATRNGLTSMMEEYNRLKMKAGGDKVGSFVDEYGKITQMVKDRYGDKAAEVYQTINDDFARMYREGSEAGILEASRESYLNHAYLSRRGDIKTLPMDFISKAKLKGKDGKGIDHSLHRIFETFDQAAAYGLEPVRDVKHLYFARRFAHEEALLNKRMLENLSLQFSLPQSVRKSMGNIAELEVNDRAKGGLQWLTSRGYDVAAGDLPTGGTSRGAAEFLAQRGVGVDDAIQKALNSHDPIWGLPRTLDGYPVTPQLYDRWASMKAELDLPVEQRSLALSQKDIRVFERAMEKNNFKFTPQEREGVEFLFNNYSQATEHVQAMGRRGEAIIDRAGETLLPDKLKRFVDKHSKYMDEDSLKFYSGSLPKPLVRTLTESYENKTLLDSMLKNPDKHGIAETPVRKALHSLAKGYLNYSRIFKFLVTAPHAAYWTKNLQGSQIQAMKSAASIGDLINPFRLIENYRIFSGKSSLVTDLGERISSKQLLREINENFGVKTTMSDAVELMKLHADNLTAAGFYLDSQKKAKTGLVKDAANMLTSKMNALENYGRQNLYVALRKKGYTPSSAAGEVRKLLVDYASGKTNFEKNYLTNILLFYSFARTEASNTLMSMLTNPGSLTKQLHLHNAYAGLLRDPNVTPPPHDLEDSIKTLRGQQQMSSFIGYDEMGNPRILTSTGMPGEEALRTIRGHAPASMKIGDIVNSGFSIFEETSKQILSMVNPALRKPVELALDRNFYFDRPLTDVTLRKVPSFARAFEALSGFAPGSVPSQVIETLEAPLLKVLKARPNGDGTYTVDHRMLATLSLFPGIERVLNQSRAIARDGSPLRLLTGFRQDTVTPEKSLAYDRKKQLEDYIVQELGMNPSMRAAKQRAIALGGL